MAKYIILTKMSPDAFENPQDFKQIAATVSDKIQNECPDLPWHSEFY